MLYYNRTNKSLHSYDLMLIILFNFNISPHFLSFILLLNKTEIPKIKFFKIFLKNDQIRSVGLISWGQIAKLSKEIFVFIFEECNK